MEFKFRSNPSAAVCSQLKNIYRHCRDSFPNLNLSSGIGTGEDAPDRYLLVFHEDNTVLAYAAIFECEITNLIYLFVDPGWQRQGIFYQMLKRLQKHYHDIPLELAANEAHPAAHHMIESGRFTAMDRQLLLSCTRSDFNVKTTPTDAIHAPVIQLYPTTDRNCLAALHHQIFHLTDEMKSEQTFIQNMLDIPGIHAFLIKSESETIGMGFLLPEENTCCLSSFGILPEHQRKGFATAALTCICEQLFKPPQMQSLTVQVDGNNTAALALYQSFGFQMVQTFSTYTLTPQCENIQNLPFIEAE
jgi:ribosomal protein S18 acetylase RimI-like enzyme/N-acetylglutamate synthase-like GNAT family acetyltransferase